MGYVCCFRRELKFGIYNSPVRQQYLLEPFSQDCFVTLSLTSLNFFFPLSLHCSQKFTYMKGMLKKGVSHFTLSI